MRRTKPRTGELARAITAHREAAGLTLEAVALKLNEMANVDTHTKGTVGRWERGERGISPKNQRYLAELYGVSVAKLHEPPVSRSIDRLLEGQPPEVWRQAEALVKALMETR